MWLYMEQSMAVIELRDQSAEKFAGNDIKVRLVLSKIEFLFMF